MNKLVNLSVAVVSLAALALPLAASAAGSVTAPGCTGTFSKVVTLRWGQVYHKTISNVAVEAAGGESIALTGNNNCVVSGWGSSINVTGNGNQVNAQGADIHVAGKNNTVTVFDAQVYLKGTGNEVTSTGLSYIVAGGAVCNVDDSSDYAVGCSS